MTFKNIVLYFLATTVGIFLTNNASALYSDYRGEFFSMQVGASYAHYINLNNKYVHGFVSAGGNLFLGTQVSDFFGPEVGITYLSLGSMGQAEILALNGRFSIPVRPNISLVGKLGVGYSEVRTCDGVSCTETNDVVPTFGVGIGVGISKSWMITAGFDGEYLPTSTRNGNGVTGLLGIGLTQFWEA